MKDTQVGGVDGWANQMGLDPEARRLPVAHAQSLDEIVPIAPRRLRKLIGDSMAERFGATASRVSPEHTRYSAIETGRRLLHYEAVWLTPARWDCVTETNAERSVRHLARLIETCVQLI